MRRMLLIAPLVLLAASAARAETGEAKEFKDKNFKWTLPSKSWAFIDLTADQRNDQYVAVVELTGQHLKAFVRVVPNGPTAEAVAEEVRGAFGADLKRTTKSAVTKGTLSGVPGT